MFNNLAHQLCVFTEVLIWSEQKKPFPLSFHYLQLSSSFPGRAFLYLFLIVQLAVRMNAAAEPDL